MPSPATDSRSGKARADRNSKSHVPTTGDRANAVGRTKRANASQQSAAAPERFGHKQMTRLGRMLASDGMIGFMLGVVVVEAATLLLMHDKNGNAPEPVLLLSFLGAGAALMSAMFFVKRIEKSALPFATALLAALFFHMWHVALLWPR